MPFEFSSVTLNLAASHESEDRVSVRDTEAGVCVVLADGAGGVSGGAEAAETVVRYFDAVKAFSEDSVARDLSKIDCQLESGATAGDSTGVVAVLAKDRIFGASVGDSEAIFLPFDGELVDLTKEQRRKPLLGSGAARPISYSCSLQPGVLLVGSDGLFHYAKFPDIISCLAGDSLEAVAGALADLARLPAGGLQDDLSLVVVRCLAT